MEKDDRSDTDEVPEDDEDETEHPIANGVHKSLANGSLTYGVQTSLANGVHSSLANGKVASNNNISPSKVKKIIWFMLIVKDCFKCIYAAMHLDFSSMTV